MTTAASTVDYEARLRSDRHFARRELEGYFGVRGRIYAVLEQLSEQLRGLDVPFTLCGGLAMYEHGCSHTSGVIELLVRAGDVGLIRSSLMRLGFAPVEDKRMTLADRSSPMRCVLFASINHSATATDPDPARDSMEIEGIHVLNLTKLIEWKLACAQRSKRRRLQCMVDVQQLIAALHLPRAYCNQLHPSVRESFLDVHRIS